MLLNGFEQKYFKSAIKRAGLTKVGFDKEFSYHINCGTAIDKYYLLVGGHGIFEGLYLHSYILESSIGVGLAEHLPPTQLGKKAALLKTEILKLPGFEELQNERIE